MRPLISLMLLVAAAPVAAQGPGPGDVFRDCAHCPRLVVIPAGAFEMGSPATEADRWEDEDPRHRVEISAPLAVGVYEVTFSEWRACVWALACEREPDDWDWGREDRPVISVTWDEAQQYVAWLSRETGQHYRLLSEAEWEYAARAGAETARYWAETEAGQCRYANGGDERAPCADGHEQTAPVGSYEPNAFGLHDMLGNVAEWTQDCWHDSYTGAPSDGSAWELPGCPERVLRGGAWVDGPAFLRLAFRTRNSAEVRYPNYGFRVARTMN